MLGMLVTPPALAGIPDSPQQVQPLPVGARVLPLRRAHDGGRVANLCAGRLQEAHGRAVLSRRLVSVLQFRLSDLHLVEPKLRNSGFEIVFLSTDRPELLYSSLKATDIHYTLLSDSHLEAAKAFHIAYHVDDATLAKRGNMAWISRRPPVPDNTNCRSPQCSSSTRRAPFVSSTRIRTTRFVWAPMRFGRQRSRSPRSNSTVRHLSKRCRCRRMRITETRYRPDPRHRHWCAT